MSTGLELSPVPIPTSNLGERRRAGDLHTNCQQFNRLHACTKPSIKCPQTTGSRNFGAGEHTEVPVEWPTWIGYGSSALFLTCATPAPVPVPCIVSAWLFLSCILYTKLVRKNSLKQMVTGKRNKYIIRYTTEE